MLLVEVDDVSPVCLESEHYSGGWKIRVEVVLLQNPCSAQKIIA